MNEFFTDKKSQLRLIYSLIIMIGVLYLFTTLRNQNTISNGKKIKGIVTENYNRKGISKIRVSYVFENHEYIINSTLEGKLREYKQQLPIGSVVTVICAENDPSNGIVDYNDDILLPDSTIINAFDD